MAAYQVKQSTTTYALVFFLAQTADHISGLTGASPTVTLSKNGGSFASPSGAVSEIANGWYKVAGNATDTGTLGPLILHATAASGDPTDMVFEVIAYDPQDAVHLGLSALPNTACTSNASLLTSGTGTDQIHVDGSGNASGNLVNIAGSAVSTTTAQLGVNVVKVNAVATTSVTAINANLGTTQALQYDGNNLPKVDLVDIAGSAVSASTAQLGVNVVNIAGTASAGTAGYVGIDWGHVNAPTTTVALSGTTVGTVTAVTNQLTAAQIATGVWQDATAGDFTAAGSIGLSLGGSLGTALFSSGKIKEVTLVDTTTTVTNQLTAAAVATGVWQDSTSGDFTVSGSIGKSLFTSGNAPGAASGLALVGSNMGTVTSVSGSVGSVTGAVGSVTGAVGSVTGNVGGNVVGSVGSISGISFPSHFGSLGITAGGAVSEVVLVDTLTTYTGDTPQTGDAYARLGAPAGVSVSADVAAVKSETDTILADVNTGAGAIYTRLGAPAGASIAADIAAVASHLPDRIAKNAALANFEVYLVSSSDHVSPATGATVAAQRSTDGAAFANCANAVTEVGAGVYKLDLAAADTNGDVVTLKFTAAGADTRVVTIVTQP